MWPIGREGKQLLTKLHKDPTKTLQRPHKNVAETLCILIHPDQERKSSSSYPRQGREITDNPKAVFPSQMSRLEPSCLNVIITLECHNNRNLQKQGGNLTCNKVCKFMGHLSLIYYCANECTVIYYYGLEFTSKERLGYGA